MYTLQSLGSYSEVASAVSPVEAERKDGCFQCGRPGHLARECERSRWGQVMGDRKPEEAGEAMTRGGATSDFGRGSMKGGTVCRISARPYMVCPRLKLIVGKQMFLGLLDSGSAVSLIDEQVFKSMNMKLEPTEIKLHSAATTP